MDGLWWSVCLNRKEDQANTVYSPKGENATGSASQQVEETDPQLNHHHPTEDEGTWALGMHS